VRLGQSDCEIWYGDTRDSEQEDELFADYMLPVSSQENTERISALPEVERLEGFPLLHLDCYTRISNAIGWPEWIKLYGYRQTGAGRGIRYGRVVNALEAVYSDAGLIVCGLSLVQPLLDKGKLSLPFPRSQGIWSEQSFRATFTEHALRRIQAQEFRDWLLREAEVTRNWLADFAGDLRK
jgi:LysR family glycine cleavage system transcriptional activator